METANCFPHCSLSNLRELKGSKTVIGDDKEGEGIIDHPL